MTRFINDYPIIPIGFIKTRTALMPKNGVCKFTPEGRALIHREQNSVPIWQIQWLREHPICSERATVKLNDNRISLFVAQNGKCAVMGDELILTKMDCHHKTLWHETKDDRYSNLVLISRDVHRLIHAITEETIQKYVEIVKPNEEQRNKINQYRIMVGNEAI